MTKLGQLIDVNKGNNFHESFEQFKGLGLSSGSFSKFSNLLQLLNDQLCQDSSVSFFWKGEWETFKKNLNVNYLKWPDLAILSF